MRTYEYLPTSTHSNLAGAIQIEPGCPEPGWPECSVLDLHGRLYLSISFPECSHAYLIRAVEYPLSDSDPAPFTWTNKGERLYGLLPAKCQHALLRSLEKREGHLFEHRFPNHDPFKVAFLAPSTVPLTARPIPLDLPIPF